MLFFSLCELNQIKIHAPQEHCMLNNIACHSHQSTSSLDSHFILNGIQELLSFNWISFEAIWTLFCGRLYITSNHLHRCEMMLLIISSANWLNFVLFRIELNYIISWEFSGEIWIKIPCLFSCLEQCYWSEMFTGYAEYVHFSDEWIRF